MRINSGCSPSPSPWCSLPGCLYGISLRHRHKRLLALQDNVTLTP